jgi:hypothetical protein
VVFTQTNKTKDFCRCTINAVALECVKKENGCSAIDLKCAAPIIDAIYGSIVPLMV